MNKGQIAAALLFVSVVMIGAGCTTVSTNTSVNSSTNTSTNTSLTTENTLTLSGLTFTLPTDWEVQSSSEGKAKIHVPDPTYRVLIPMNVKEVPTVNVAGEALLRETSTGAKIYQSVCAPAIACYYVVVNNKTYRVDFGVPESDEPPPAVLDGVWFASTTVTKEQTLSVVATVR